MATAHTLITETPREYALGALEDFSAYKAKSTHGDYSRVFAGSKYSVQAWIDAAQEALGEDDYGPFLDMCEEDNWDMSSLETSVPPQVQS